MLQPFPLKIPCQIWYGCTAS